MEEARLEKELIGTNLGRIRNQIGEADFKYISHRMAPTRAITSGRRRPIFPNGAYQRNFLWQARGLPEIPGRRRAYQENSPGRRGLSCLLSSSFLPSSFLDSFSSLPSPFQSINLRNVIPRSYVQAPCCLQIIATPWNHNELSKTLQSSSFLAR